MGYGLLKPSLVVPILRPKKMTRTQAKLQQAKTYHGRPHKGCGSTEKYVTSMSCVQCELKRSRHKLDNKELMAPYRTKEKGRKKLYRWRSANPTQRKVQHLRANLMKLYRMTLTEYDAMLSSQDRKCVICGGTNANGKRLAVDHDHSTGKVRGLLCSHCNTGLGMFRDDVARLRKAIKYLEKG